MEELGECLEHKIIRTNLANITQLISSDPSAGPTWFALKLEEKAFIASAADAVVSGCSTSRQTSALLGAVKSKITTSQEPKKEFAKFIEILRSNPPLEGLAKELVQECGVEGDLHIIHQESEDQSNGHPKVSSRSPMLTVKALTEPLEQQPTNRWRESVKTSSNTSPEAAAISLDTTLPTAFTLTGTQEPHDASTWKLQSCFEQQSDVSPGALASPPPTDTETPGNDKLQVVQREVTKLEDKYEDLVLHTQEVFSKKERKSPDFLSLLRTSLALLTTSPVKKGRYIRFLKASQNEISKAGSVARLFLILSHYWNYFNYSLLEYLIEKFGDKTLRKKLKSYLADLHKFEKSTKVEDFIHTCGINDKMPPRSLVMVTDMKSKGADCTIDRVRGLCQKFVEAACLEGYCIFFLGGSCSRVILMWAVPSSVGHLLAKAMDESFLEKHEIEAVTIDGKGLHDYLLEKSLQPEVKQRPDPQELILACENGDLCDALDLLDAGVPVNTQDARSNRSKMTPLHWASKRGHHDTVRILLEYHADVNAHERWDQTPLHQASETGHHDTVRVLLEHHADVNTHDWWEKKTPLLYASERGHHDTVRVLLEHHADVNAHERWEKKTPLHYASERGHHDTVRVLLEHHADVNAHDESKKTPLHYASERGHLDTVRVFLEHHADVNTHDMSKKTPLHYASERGHLDTVRVFLEHHADVNAHDKPLGKTPLHYASERGHHDSVRVLLEHHADVNALDRSGMTPLHYASVRGHHDTVRVLLEHHANINAHDWVGRTPMDLASGYPEVIEELKKYVPGASCRLTTMKDPKPMHMTTSSEHPMVEKLEEKPSSSSEHPGPEHRPTRLTSEHSTASKAKRKSSLTGEEED